MQKDKITKISLVQNLKLIFTSNKTLFMYELFYAKARKHYITFTKKSYIIPNITILSIISIMLHGLIYLIHQ